MNLLKKIWTTIVGLFPNRRITGEKLISTVERVWEKPEERKKIIETIQNIKNDESKAIIIATIDQIEKEIKKLDDKKERINERLGKIAEIATPDNLTEINDSLNKIKKLIETKTSLTSSLFSLSSPLELDNFLNNSNLLKQFRGREEKRKKKEELDKKQIRSKLGRISTFISQDKLNEAKLLIAQIQKQIKNSYKHELERLSEIQQKLEEKELQILKKLEEEAQRKRDEEVERLKEFEERRKEEKKQNQQLGNFGINYLHHMTHKDNLEKILQVGLKSHNYARKNNLMQRDIANKDVNDRRNRIELIHNRSLHDYVPLYFNPKNPMLYTRKDSQDNIIILAIDKMLICAENSIFTDGNAANNPTKFFNDTSSLTQINWECIHAEYWSGFADGKRERMAEVLVYPDIPVEYIQKIYCNNFDTLQFIQEKTRNFQYIKTELTRNLYF